MERFTISLDEDLAQEFDQLILARGYSNRSEAVRDMLRAELEKSRQVRYEGTHCIAALSYVYNHHERELAERLTALQHDHHDLTVSTLHAHLDHDNCIECVVLRGKTAEVRDFAGKLIAERGVRHGNLSVITVSQEQHKHRHGLFAHSHIHYKPHN